MELIDWSVFSEIVSMDQDEEGFALSLIETFITQAQDTIAEISAKLGEGPSPEGLAFLSAKGHYLKGSAAALGFIAVQARCEEIQNSGKDSDLDRGLANVTTAFDQLQVVLKETRKVLGEYFHMEL